jgi:hypothetical protein
MFEKKLVEKNVEVTVTEKRIVAMYIHEGSEYTKEDLRQRLNGQLVNKGDSTMAVLASRYRCKTAWKKMYNYTDSKFYKELYDDLDKVIKLIQSLDNDVDKD